MSAPLSPAEVVFRQRLLSCAGIYTGKLDGVAGPATSKAEAEWDATYTVLRDQYGARDPRTEACIHSLLPKMQALARQLLQKLDRAGFRVRILSGTRSYAEQDRIYAQGRTKPGLKVTNAKPGQSNHQFGIAVDLGLFGADGTYLTSEEPYSRAGAIGRTIPGLEWGGDWKRPDRPHYQKATGLSLAEVRRRFEAGKPY
jgi:peptidoglycan L-alanyl-D-glutamate endopeptidase CwlK